MPSLKREDKVSRRGGDEERDVRDDEIKETLVNLGAAKKYQKWLSFVKPRMVLGFDRISKEIQPEVLTKPRGLALCFEKVHGWTIPNHMLEDMDVKGYQVSVQLSLSMFHTASRSFFGSTWMGTPIQLNESDRDNLAAVVDFNYTDLLYMISRLQDKTCVAVIEIVASTIDTRSEVLVSQHGCGWTMLAIFANQFTDISRGYDEGKEMSSTLYTGSPRDLIMKRDALDTLHEINGCALHYRIFESFKLLKMQNLVAENAVLGRFEVIAGLKPKGVTLPDEVRKKRVACIGDHEEMLGKQGVRVVPCVPQLASSLTLSVIDWHLLIPSRSRFEARVRVKTTTQLQLQQGAAESQILSRVLKIGLHNGHTLINADNEWLRIPLEEDADDKDVLLLPSDRSTLVLDGYVPHENVALVFLVEYEVGVFRPQATQYDVHSTIDAIFGEETILRTTVSIGATAHIPFDGKHFQLKNISEDEREGNDDELNMELELLPNQLCQVLSQNLIFSDEDHRRLVATAQAKVATKGLMSADAEDELANENPVIGFDMKINNKRKKEFRHLESLDEGGSDVDSDLESDSDGSGGHRTGRKRRAHLSPHDKQTSHFVKSDHPRRDDDAMSLMSEPSLVGGSSDASSLRLDPDYYTSGRAQLPLFAAPALTSTPMFRDVEQPNLQLPTGRQSSLLARSMETRLGGSRPLVHKNVDDELLRESRSHGLRASHQRSVFSDEDPRGGGAIGHLYNRSPHTSQQVMDHSARADVKDLSRASRARLSRHGFSDAIGDSSLPHQQQQLGGNMRLSQHKPEISMAVDIEAEAKDDLNVHEINIQFAGYRVGYPKQSHDKTTRSHANATPRCVYFSFQFFTCRPTRTEIMRLLPSTSANSDEFSVLVRDEANSSRNEAPLVLRYIINSSEVSPLEAVEFAEYLAHGTLYVDTWDADSLLHIGTFGLPLSRLLRQGKSVAKAGLESNVINSESSLRADRGGVYTTVIADGAAPAGTVVGSVNVLLANYGQKGPTCNDSKDAKKSSDIHTSQGFSKNSLEGLNWRAVDEDRQKLPSKHRPKMSVRAKPLTESAPELNKALKEHRIDDGRCSNRSLSALRGNEGVHSLTYDDIMILFKRFQGNVKGTIQYSGQLMKLLDLPNSLQALLKLFKLYKECMARRLDMKQLLVQYADGKGQLTAADFKEFLRDTFEQCAISSSQDENNIITHRVFTSHSPDNKSAEPAKFLQADEIISFCVAEIGRQEWVVSSRRLLRTVQKAYLANVDVEQEMSEKDELGKHSISVNNFQLFLKELSRYGSLSAHDIEVIIKHFRRHEYSNAEAISLRDVASFMGKRYVGNVKARFREILCRPNVESNEMSTETILTLSGAKGVSNEEDGVTRHVKELCNTLVPYADLDDRLQNLNVFGELTHDQVRRVVTQVTGSAKGISIVELINYLGITHNLEVKKVMKPPPEDVKKYADMSAEELLKLLVDKARSDNGISFDQTFRYFDADGNGSISEEELEKGIEQLQVFNDIPNWREQIPAMGRKFDPNGDGQISLKEFFAYFGYKDYIPNTIQRLTMIFATANVPLREIFKEFDSDGSGYLTAAELKAALKGIGGTFEELSQADADSIVKHFDSDGDGQTSQDEFTAFFEERVKSAKRERKVKARQRFQRRFKLVLMAVIDEGGSLEEIFQHFNKDDDGAISHQELKDGLKSLKHFKNLTKDELGSLVSVLDTNNDGSISFQEFKRFVTDSSQPDVTPVKKDQKKSTPKSPEEEKEDKSKVIIERLHKIFKGASKKASVDEIFGHLDKNRDGAITLKELHTGLKKMAYFSTLQEEDYVDLFFAIDQDDSGEISIKEFIEVVMKGEVPPRKKKSPSPKEKKSSYRDGNDSKDARGDRDKKDTVNSQTDKKALFIRLVNNIARSEDGGITGMLAYLDDDEDGLISLTMLLRYFRREDLFGNSRDRDADRGDHMEERDVEDLLSSVTRKDGFIRVDSLMSYFAGEGKSGPSVKAHVGDGEDFDELTREDSYEFSKNPETLVLEKKLRQLGGILAKKGMNIEGIFRDYDTRYSGMIRRTEFLEILSKLGLYILEKAASGEGAASDDHDADFLSRKQQQQVSRIKQGGRGGDYADNAIKTAARMSSMSPSHAMHGGEFKDHLESMAMINWYRQGQKRMLLQRVLSHSLASVIHLYPKFAKTLFFEFPLSNPFGHEERFLIEISDPELRIVTSFDEWSNLRATCRPCYGVIGDEPVEAEMFDADMAGNVQVALLPQETLSIPFSFVTFEPFFQPAGVEKSTRKLAARGSRDGRASEAKDNDEPTSEVATSRVVNVRVISGSHGHVISVIKVHIHPRPFVVNRNIAFYEPENTVMKRRLRVTGRVDRRSQVPGRYNAASKYVHCVETATGGHGGMLGADGGGNQVLVEWGDSEEGLGNLDLIVRYRCLEFPHVGSFYIILYNDPHQCSLHEIWQFTVHTRQKLDLHCTLGNATSLDLVVRGDRYARRSRAWHSPASTSVAGGSTAGVDQVSLRPDIPFQLVPGAYNRVMLSYLARSLGTSRMQVNVVDVDTRELISAWLLFTTAAAPAVMRSYDVEVTSSRPTQKKIIFKNPWDMSRKFVLVSSNEEVMRPRTEALDVSGQGSVYLKLWFNRGEEGAPPQDVYLFLNDPSGRTEECFLFQVFTV